MHLLVNKFGKVLYDDNGTFSDKSHEMTSWTSDTMDSGLVLAEDYIYIGCPHSFASRFFLFETFNDVAADLTVEYYYGGTNWRSVKNLEDQTKVAGVPFAKNNFISWDLPSDWIKTQVNGLPELPYDVSSVDGQGYYWVRIKSSVSLNVATSIKWLGLIWTNHDFLTDRWPEVVTDRYLPTGKTDWYELIEMSTRDVVDDLGISNVIEYELQAKDIDEVAKLTALKSLVNILIPMSGSENLRIMKEEFRAEYNKLLKKRLKGIDRNKDEKISKSEEQPMTNGRIMRY